MSNRGVPPMYDYPYQGEQSPPEVEPLYGDLRFPGHGLPRRPGEDRPGMSAWGRLSRGGALGKKTVLVYRNNADEAQRAETSILEIQGDDMDARQIALTLLPPLAIRLPFSETLARDPQNKTGEQGNEQYLSGNFPGTSAPIAWPPIEAVVSWGIGGASSQAIVDFVNGCTVNLVASFLRVHARVPANTGFSGTSALYTLAAFVGPGWPRPGSATKTVYYPTIGSGAESVALPVPPYARSACVLNRDDAGTPVATNATLRLWQSPNKTLSAGNLAFGGSSTLPQPISAAAMYASVLNGSATGSGFAVVYELSI